MAQREVFKFVYFQIIIHSWYQVETVQTFFLYSRLNSLCLPTYIYYQKDTQCFFLLQSESIGIVCNVYLNFIRYGRAPNLTNFQFVFYQVDKTSWSIVGPLQWLFQLSQAWGSSEFGHNSEKKSCNFSRTADKSEFWVFLRKLRWIGTFHKDIFGWELK